MTRGQLYHVTLTISSRDENPGARGEQRTYTPRGQKALSRRLVWLRERFPAAPVVVTPVKPDNRSPVIL